MNEQSKPSLEAMWDILRNQQRKIEELEARQPADDKGPAAENGAGQHVSRAGMLKAAALGVATVAGAGILLEEQTGVAHATGPEGQTSFSSSTTTPTVTVLNSSTGQALRANATSSSPAVAATNHSTANGAQALAGTISSNTPGTSSVGVRGINAGTGSAGIGVYGTHGGGGTGVWGRAPSGNGVFGATGTGSGVKGLSNSYGYGVRGESTGGGQAVSGYSTYGIAVDGRSDAYYAAYFSSGSDGSKFGFGGVLHLEPDQNKVTTPSTGFGQIGDLWVDSNGGLWYRNSSGWTHLA